MSVGLYGPRGLIEGVDDAGLSFVEMEMVMFAGQDYSCPDRWTQRFYMGLCHGNYLLSYVWDLYHADMLRCWFSTSSKGEIILLAIVRADKRRKWEKGPDSYDKTQAR